MPKCSHTASTIFAKYSTRLPPHGVSAPSFTDSSPSATSSGSTSSFEPRPAQFEHAPYGVLKENCRGASSSKLMPQNRHAKFCENEWRPFDPFGEPFFDDSGIST